MCRIDTHPIHGFVVCHDRETLWQLHTLDSAPDHADEVFHDVSNLRSTDSPGAIGRASLRNEGHLEIDLGELGLAILPAVFVAKAFGNLVISIYGA
jgi:hypothetical protein